MRLGLWANIFFNKTLELSRAVIIIMESKISFSEQMLQVSIVFNACLLYLP
jgi:hypothetical protein